MNEPSNCTGVAPRDTVERKRDGVHDASPSSDQVEGGSDGRLRAALPFQHFLVKRQKSSPGGFGIHFLGPRSAESTPLTIKFSGLTAFCILKTPEMGFGTP